MVCVEVLEREEMDLYPERVWVRCC
jgi:hypothetical protein